LGKPGSRNSALSPAAAGHVATLYASLSRPQHHQTRVSPTEFSLIPIFVNR